MTKEPVPMEFEKKDISFAMVMIVFGFLYWNLIKPEDFGAGVSIFSLLLCTAVAVYLRLRHFSQSKRSLFCLGLILLSAAQFILFDHLFIKGLNFIFLSVLFVYWVGLTTSRTLNRNLSVYVVGDLINQLFVVPFTNLNCCFSGIWGSLVKNKRGKEVFAGILGIVIFLPVLGIVTGLLVEADAAFESLISNIRFNFSEVMIEYMLQVILGLPVACYLYGLIYGNSYSRHTGHITIESMDKGASSLRFAPGVAVYSGLTALIAIYFVFFISQAVYLFSAFGNNLPESMTYAEYARRGFFELCAVSSINLFVITAANLVTSRKTWSKESSSRVLKIQTFAICVFTLMLIVTAMSKMAMYISSYGLTQLRVYTSWFMILLFVTFTVVAVRQLVSFNGTRIVIAGFLIGFMLLSYGNVDGRIAKYNIDRFRDGTLETIDITALQDLSDGAVPYLFELYNETEDGLLKSRLVGAITGNRDLMEFENQRNTNFRDFNFQKYEADQIRGFFYKD